jgi:hypothetical protein
MKIFAYFLRSSLLLCLRQPQHYRPAATGNPAPLRFPAAKKNNHKNQLIIALGRPPRRAGYSVVEN